MIRGVLDYTGVWATPKLINRKPILNEIRKAVRDRGAPYVFYITGRGGMGKTFLLREVLRRLREGPWSEPEVLAAQDVVDLYHPPVHVVEGLCRAIRAVLRPGLGYFADFQQERERLARIRRDLDLRDIGWQEERMLHAFREDFRSLEDDYRVVLAFDTAEVLLYEPDPVQQSLALAPQGIEARGWLIERFLPSLENTIVLIAGRPGPPRLREDLRAALGERLIERTLGPLEEPDSLDYFQTVAQVAREQGSEVVAARLEAIPEETRRVIHLYTEGRPILLALTIDYLAVADRLLPEVQTPLEEARAMSSDQLRQVRERLEREIVRAIQETGRPADEAVRALAWTQRGMNARLLARLLETAEEEAERLLESLRPLSFVKVRPADNRVFLQDEMYALLERHVLSRLPEARARWVYDTILRFYNEEIEEARQELQRLQADPEAPLDLLERTRVRLQNAIAERVHYALRRDPEQGFEAYYQAAEEAFIASHRALDMQLRVELLEFLSQASQEATATIADWSTWDLGVRWIKRSIVSHRYDEAVQIATRLRVEVTDLMERLGPVAEAELSVWEGWARTYAGQGLDLAEGRLRTAIEALDRLQPRTPFERDQQRALLARAYNSLGYLLRVRGRFREAVEQYRRALPLWRALGPAFESEAANTLNNLAWALAETGKFGQAIRLCQDALEIRRRLGPRYPVALSLNTLAMIQIRNDRPDQAEELAQRALAIFFELENWRGIGMSSRALAEALRRKAWLPYQYTPEQQEELLRKARRLADEAVAIFTHRVEERSRLIEALIELGCIYRDWVRIHPLASALEATAREEMALRAERTLQRAAEEAGETFPHLRVDALVNLAWLYFYAGQPEGAEETVEEVFQSLPADFFITPERGVPRRDLSPAFFWVQIGKAHMLLALMAMDRFRSAYERLRAEGKSREEALDATRDLLQKGVEHFTLALAHDVLYAPDFRDLRRGKDLFYQSLKGLNPAELRLAYETARQVERECRLDENPARQLLEEYFGLPEAYEETVG